jgi:hypothetical protein
MADISLVTGSIDIGDATFSKTTPVGSGTGLYDPFLATHDSNANGQTNDGVAEGFNNDATGILDVDASKTSSLKLSDMPIKVIDGVEYYEFRVDLNETNNVAGRIVTLNEFKIYTSTSPATLANFNNTTDEFGAGFTKVYDLDAGEDRTLILRDDNSGSGTDDYSVLIKVSAFGDVDPTTTYLTLYTNMGRQPGVRMAASRSGKLRTSPRASPAPSSRTSTAIPCKTRARAASAALPSSSTGIRMAPWMRVSGRRSLPTMARTLSSASVRPNSARTMCFGSMR